MTSSRPPITDPDKASEQIVAYLDGELSAEGCQELEERLARDPEFRAQLNNYQRTWEMLDDLPRTMADARFAASTIEMVAIAANRDATEASDGWPLLAKRPWVSVLLGIGLAFIIGFMVVRATAALLGDDGSQARANQQLLVDLPVIQRVEIYQTIDSIEFIRRLAASDLFPAKNRPAGRPRESSDDAVDALADSQLDGFDFASASHEERRRAIENLSSDEKHWLLQKQRIFSGLAPAQQQQIRKLHRQIEADPAAAQLLVTAARYAHWHSRLEWDRTIELAGMSPQQRIDRIRQWQDDDEREHDRRRKRDDLMTTLRWLGRFAVEHQREVIKHAPHLKRRGGANANSAAKRRVLIKAMLRHWHDVGEPKDPDLDTRSMNQLLRSLSPETRREVQQARGVAAQWTTLRRLLQSAFAQELAPHERRKLEGVSGWPLLERMLAEGHRPPPHKPDANEEGELWDLFNERLTDHQRTELEQLSREEILERLREYSHQHHRPGAADRKRDDSLRPRRAPPRGGPSPKRRRPDEFDADDPLDFRRPPPRERDRDPEHKRGRRPPEKTSDE